MLTPDRPAYNESLYRLRYRSPPPEHDNFTRFFFENYNIIYSVIYRCGFLLSLFYGFLFVASICIFPYVLLLFFTVIDLVTVVPASNNKQLNYYYYFYFIVAP